MPKKKFNFLFFPSLFDFFFVVIELNWIEYNNSLLSTHFDPRTVGLKKWSLFSLGRGGDSEEVNTMIISTMERK